MMQSLDDHLELVSQELAAGRVVPFFGAGVNLCGRPDKTEWKPGCDYLPNGGELARHLARKYKYPSSDIDELTRVSQYISIVSGSGSLYEDLHELLDSDYAPTAVHQFFAGVSRTLRERGFPRKKIPRYQLLLVTTNYDDLLERAFDMANEQYDVVTYVAEGEDRGKFWHQDPAGYGQLIHRPNEYLGVSLDVRPVILKIHGAINRLNPESDSYVITEDNYIDYLTRTDVSSLLPVTLGAELRNSHFLFLGYRLRDWNLRVILHRIWSQQKVSFKSWAVQRTVEVVEREFWRKWNVDILAVRLEDYIAGLAQRVAVLQV